MIKYPLKINDLAPNNHTNTIENDRVIIIIIQTDNSWEFLFYGFRANTF
jgi:hypothetical protein